MVVVIAFGGVAALMYGLAIMMLARAGGRDSVKVPGQITGARDYVSRGRTMYVSELMATLPDGRVIRGTGNMGKSWKPNVGASVTLIYRPHDPENPLIEAGFLRFLAPLILAAIGTMFGVTAVMGFVAMMNAADAGDAAKTKPAKPKKEHVERH